MSKLFNWLDHKNNVATGHSDEGRYNSAMTIRGLKQHKPNYSHNQIRARLEEAGAKRIPMKEYARETIIMKIRVQLKVAESEY